ncbi:11867_t:CDS:2, partial [Funneliformis geosporum]
MDERNYRIISQDLKSKFKEFERKIDQRKIIKTMNNNWNIFPSTGDLEIIDKNVENEDENILLERKYMFWQIITSAEEQIMMLIRKNYLPVTYSEW